MGFVTPPPPISEEEFEKRMCAGARTIEEIDPALAKWARSGIHGILWRKPINATMRKDIAADSLANASRTRR